MDQENIAKILRLLKTHTIKQVCEETGFSKSTVSGIKNNKIYDYNPEGYVRLPPGLKRTLKAVHKNTGEPKSRIIKRALTRYFETLPDSTKTLPADLD